MEGYRFKEDRKVETERRPHNFSYFAEKITAQMNKGETNYGECRKLRRELYKSDVSHEQEFLIGGAINKVEKDITRRNVGKYLGTDKFEKVISKAEKMDAIDWTERELFYKVHNERVRGFADNQSREEKLVMAIFEGDIERAREIVNVDWNRRDPSERSYVVAYNNMLDKAELEQISQELVVCTNARGFDGYKEIIKEHEDFFDNHKDQQEFYYRTLPNSFIR